MNLYDIIDINHRVKPLSLDQILAPINQYRAGRIPRIDSSGNLIMTAVDAAVILAVNGDITVTMSAVVANQFHTAANQHLEAIKAAINRSESTKKLRTCFQQAEVAF